MLIMWGGGEDSDFSLMGNATMVTTAGKFRTGFAREAIAVGPSAAGSPGTSPITQNVISAASFWLHAEMINDDTNPNLPNWLLSFMDSSNVDRIVVRNDAVGTASLQVMKRNAAGVLTALCTTAGGIVPLNELFTLDMFVNYAVSGQVTLYINQVQVATFSGDVTTDSATQLAALRLGSAFSGATTWWSECIIADADTRTLSLVTMAPVANGNTHNFDTGSPSAPTASQVNELVLDDSTWDGSTTAGQIDQYTCPAIPAGTFTVRSVGVSARMVKGVSGPSKADLNVRTGGSDFFSSDQSLTLGLANYQNWWATNPNTSAAWTTAQIGNASGFNIGVKSVT